MGEESHRISVIVPVLDDTLALNSLLRQLKELSTLEVVVADGGKDEETRKVGRYYGAGWVQSPQGRGSQMTRGAWVSESNR